MNNPEVYGDWPNDPRSEQVRQEQERDRNARRKEAEEAVDTLFLALEQLFAAEEYEDDYVAECFKALEFLSWECGCLEFFKRLRSE